MPVSHIGLTVSHLPTSTSFFLSALQPLGYRFIGQQGHQIGLGISDADFFLCQESAGIQAGAAHIAFTAPSRSAVRDFYAAALNAGGRPHGAPALRNEATGHFNAAILDFDGNSIEVVCREGEDDQVSSTSIKKHSRVLTWRKTVSENDRATIISTSSVSSVSTVKTLTQALSVIESARAPSVTKDPSAAPSMPSIARSLTEPLLGAISAATSGPAASSKPSGGDATAKTIIGTLIGAAAGAAVAYAMCKGEQDSAKKEAAAFLALHQQRKQLEAEAQAAAAAAQAAAVPPPVPTPLPAIGYAPSGYAPSRYTPSQVQYGNTPVYAIEPNFVAHSTREGSVYSAASARAPQPQRLAIEAGPALSYHMPSYTSVPPTVANSKAIEYYVPAASVVSGSGRSHASLARSQSYPASPASLMERVHPSEAPARSSAPRSSVSRSGSKAAASTVSKRSHHTSSRSHAPAPSEAPAPSKAPSKAGSIIGSILGRSKDGDAKSHVVVADPEPISDASAEDYSDGETVAPSDSISCAGSSRSRRPRRSHHSHSHSHRSKRSSSHSSKHRRDSVVEKDKDKDSASSASNSSRHQSKSHHHSSRHSHVSRRHSDDAPSAPKTVVSEAQSQSTVKPRRKKSKESIVQWNGSVASMPMRGITASMLGDPSEKVKGDKSGVSYAYDDTKHASHLVGYIYNLRKVDPKTKK